MIPDPYARTVLIPVRVVGNRVQPLHGGKFPRLKAGTVGDLIVGAYAFEVEADLKALAEEAVHELLPAKMMLAARVRDSSQDQLDADTRKYLSDTWRRYVPAFSLRTEKYDPDTTCFAEILLLEPLRILARGTKHAKLLPCKCRVPFLDVEAESINQAYTLISEALERARLSHTGNCFRLVYHFDGKRLWALDDLRVQVESLVDMRLAKKSAGKCA